MKQIQAKMILCGVGHYPAPGLRGSAAHAGAGWQRGSEARDTGTAQWPHPLIKIVKYLWL